MSLSGRDTDAETDLGTVVTRETLLG